MFFRNTRLINRWTRKTCSEVSNRSYLDDFEWFWWDIYSDLPDVKVRHRRPAHKLSGPIWVRNITIVSSNVTLSLRYKYTNDFWFIFESKLFFRASIPSRSDLDPIKRRSKGIILPMLAISNKMGTKNRPKIIKITKIMMKNRFFKFALETFLGHLGWCGGLYLDIWAHL